MIDFIDSNFTEEDIKEIKTYLFPNNIVTHFESTYYKWLNCNMNSMSIITWYKIKKMLNNG